MPSAPGDTFGTWLCSPTRTPIQPVSRSRVEGSGHCGGFPEQQAAERRSSQWLPPTPAAPGYDLVVRSPGGDDPHYIGSEGYLEEERG